MSVCARCGHDTALVEGDDLCIECYDAKYHADWREILREASVADADADLIDQDPDDAGGDAANEALEALQALARHAGVPLPEQPTADDVAAAGRRLRAQLCPRDERITALERAVMRLVQFSSESLFAGSLAAVALRAELRTTLPGFAALQAAPDAQAPEGRLDLLREALTSTAGSVVLESADRLLVVSAIDQLVAERERADRLLALGAGTFIRVGLHVRAVNAALIEAEMARRRIEAGLPLTGVSEADDA